MAAAQRLLQNDWNRVHNLQRLAEPSALREQRLNAVTPKLIVVSAAAVLVIGTVPVSASTSPDPGQRIDVRITDSGPWIAQLVNFDLATVQSVTYYVRDAGQHWTATKPVTASPFEAPIDWWAGDNEGYEVVTAHVVLLTGETIKDPGGWHWVDGHHTDPKGSINAWINPDDTIGASYKPDFHATDVSGVNFWYRDCSGRWHNAGSATQDDADWVLVRFDGVTWACDTGDAIRAVSVHVIWVNGRQLIDPTDWATTYDTHDTSGYGVLGFGSPGVCGNPTAHVYNPGRLKLLSPCVTVNGVVDIVRPEKDGDYHVLLHLDPGQDKYVNETNVKEQGGDLVVEPVCLKAPTQPDSVPACNGVTYAVDPSVYLPSPGDHVSVSGAWVIDLDHGWMEIHPAAYIGPVDTSTPTPPPTPSSPPSQFAVNIAASTYGYIAASTTAGATCSAKVRLPSGNYSQAQGLLASQTAGQDGSVSWTYRTSSRTTKGIGTSFVTCNLAGITATASATFTVS